MIKSLSGIAALLLIFGHVQLEFAEWYEKLFGGDKYINPFIRESYVYPHYENTPEGIPITWWIKFVCDDILWIITFIILTLVAKKYSYRLFVVSSVFLGYHLFDHFMLWYDFRTSHWLYWIELAMQISGLIMLFLIKDKITAKVKSLI